MAIRFTIDGSWLFINRGSPPTPVEGARVEFWQQVSRWVDWFDHRVGTAYTDSNGQYSGGFISGHRHNFYSRLVLNDDAGARLHNWWTGSSWSINTGTGSNTSGGIHNDLVISKNGGASTPKVAVWQGARVAAQEYRTTIGAPPPAADYDIALETTIFPTPWSTLSTTHWPDGYDNRGNNGPYSVNMHEFGHTIRHSLDGDFLHFLYDAVRFWYPRMHSPTDCHDTGLGFAFNEGWAEFWATEWGAVPPAAPCDPPTDTMQEGNVAAALYGVSQCPAIGRAGMVGVLRANPRRIHSYAEFEAALKRAYQCEVQIGRGVTTDHNVGEEVAIAVAERREATQGRLDEQAQVTAVLKQAYEQAVTAASDVEPCHTVDACEMLFQTVTGPPLLAGRITQSEEVTRRLQRDLRQLDDYQDDDDHGDRRDDDNQYPRLIRDDTYAQHLADQHEFDRQTYTTIVAATHDALSVLNPFLREDATGALAGCVADLVRSLRDLESRHACGVPPPEAAQPPGAVFSETVA